MKWIEVKIKTTTEAIEAVSNILYDVGVSGVVIEDPKDLTFKEKEVGGWDYVDEALLQNVLEGAIVKGYLPESEDLIDKVEWIRQSVEMISQYNLDKGLGEVTTTEIYDEDWANEWKKYYKPKKIGNKIVVKPTWESYTPQAEEIIVELDPGMAFGTGTHETTMMCVQNLEKYVTPNSLVFDIGCGSGILAITAAKLGAKKVVGIDLDKIAVEVSQKNVEDNHVQQQVAIKQGNLLDTLHERADIVVANIIADVIVILAEDIKKFLNRDSIFIASGIILEKVHEVTGVLEKNGLEILQTEIMGEWVAIVSKPEGGQKNE